MKYTHNHRFLLPTNRANVRELSGLSAYESRFNNGESATIKPVEFDGIKKQAGLNSFVLTNLESLNSVLIRQGLPQSERLLKLNEIAITQMRSLLTDTNIKRLK